MRFLFLLFVTLFGVSSALAQNPANSLPKLPEDPRGMLLTAAPLYDFNNAALKPWHLKGTYQLFDESGKPREQGTYEYWWSAPEVYRSTWTRPSGSRTEWHAAGGQNLYVASGSRILALERELRSLLVSAVPDVSKLDPADAEFKKDQIRVDKDKLPCAEIHWMKHKDGSWPTVPEIRGGSYCFEGSEPLLRVLRFSNTEYVEFDHLKRTQEHFIAGGISWSFGAHRILTFSLDAVDLIGNDDAALRPSTDAKNLSGESVQTSGAATSRLIKKQAPIYPYQLKASHLSGMVVLDTLIGSDGRVRDMYALASPSPFLTKAAEDAVAQWQYAPYLVNGQPQEVSTRINIIFDLR